MSKVESVYQLYAKKIDKKQELLEELAKLKSRCDQLERDKARYSLERDAAKKQLDKHRRTSLYNQYVYAANSSLVNMEECEHQKVECIKMISFLESILV